MRGKKGQPVYQEFALGLFIKALIKLDFKYNTKLPRNIQTFLPIDNHFANNIHFYFCSCIKLSNKISSSSVVSILFPKILELSTLPCQVQGIFHPKRSIKRNEVIIYLKAMVLNLGLIINYNYLYIKVFI